MKVNKRVRGYSVNSFETPPFARITGRAVALNATVRNWILPFRHIIVSIENNGDVLLTPTNDENEYKLTVINSMTRFSALGLLADSNIPTGIRIPCEKTEEGKIIIKVSEVKR